MTVDLEVAWASLDDVRMKTFDMKLPMLPLI